MKQENIFFWVWFRLVRRTHTLTPIARRLISETCIACGCVRANGTSEYISTLSPFICLFHFIRFLLIVSIRLEINLDCAESVSVWARLDSNNIYCLFIYLFISKFIISWVKRFIYLFYNRRNIVPIRSLTKYFIYISGALIWTFISVLRIVLWRFRSHCLTGFWITYVCRYMKWVTLWLTDGVNVG